MAKTIEKTIKIMEKKGYTTHFDYITEAHILKIAFVKVIGNEKIVKTIWNGIENYPKNKVEHYRTYTNEFYYE